LEPLWVAGGRVERGGFLMNLLPLNTEIIAQNQSDAVLGTDF
jgi:hypothetical protein